MNRSDPGDHIAWLEEQFKMMEENREFAIILGHVPPGQECLNEFASRYSALMDRYQHVIRLQVFGHDHREKYN
jgi:sphingomyelin phosphodiesterase